MNLSDKTAFILAFAALVIGLSSFGTELQKISIDLGFTVPSLMNLGVIFLLLLLVSIYLYALDSIRYGLSSLDNHRAFKFIQQIAHFFYMFAIISPILIFGLWLIVVIVKNFPVVNVRGYTEILSITSSFLGVFIAFAVSWFQTKEKETVVQEKINEQVSNLMVETSGLFKEKKWRLSLVESFRLLELLFRNKADEQGIDFSRIPFSRLVSFFVDRGYITKTQAAKLGELRELRNLAIHSEKEISKEQASYAMDVINDVSKSIILPSFTNSYFENKVYLTLSKYFPKHHIFPQFQIGDRRIDFMAEGPDYIYYVEAKMVESPAMISLGIDQIRSILGKQDRGILVLPVTAKRIAIGDQRIKIAYFDIQKEKFANQKEIYHWIYSKENANKL